MKLKALISPFKSWLMTSNLKVYKWGGENDRAEKTLRNYLSTYREIVRGHKF